MSHRVHENNASLGVQVCTSTEQLSKQENELQAVDAEIQRCPRRKTHTDRSESLDFLIRAVRGLSDAARDKPIPSQATAPRGASSAEGRRVASEMGLLSGA